MKTNEILKELRQQKDLTQQELATTLDINLSSYQKYERPNNTIKPSLDTLIKLADYYNVSVDYLLGRSEPKNPLLEMAIKPINDEEMWQAYDKLPDVAKEIFVEVMEVLAKASRKKEEPKEIEQNVYPIPTLTHGKKGANVEYMTEEEINDILSAEDADEDL